MPFAALLALVSLATAGVAVWLVFVTVFVLPSRDPAHIPMWRAIAGAFFAFSALSWAALAGRGRHTLLRGSLLIASLGAIALGVFGIIDMLRRASASGDFEGYILLMGIIVAGHGMAGVGYALRHGNNRVARSVGDEGRHLDHVEGGP